MQQMGCLIEGKQGDVMDQVEVNAGRQEGIGANLSPKGSLSDLLAPKIKGENPNK